MAAAIPLFCFVFIFLTLRNASGKDGSLLSWRGSFLSATLITGIIFIALSEALSLFRLLTFGAVSSAWIVVLCTSFLVYRTYGRAPVQRTPSVPSVFPRSALPFLLAITGIVLVIGVIAARTPPLDLEAMRYHMPRIVHWIQNGSISSYPTYRATKQLLYPPGMELIAMHIYMLSGGDHLSSLMQWFCMVASIVGISLITKRLGGDVRTQLFAAVLCATIPMGILQGSSTRNDYATTLWIILFAYYALLLIQGTVRTGLLFGAGASLGLAILTKGTAYLFALPILGWLAFSLFRRSGLSAWKSVLLVPATAAFINTGYYARNMLLQGRIFVTMPQLVSAGMTVPLFLSNFIRNIALHLGTPVQPLNRTLERIIGSIHGVLGIATNDPRITYLVQDFHIPFSFHQGDAGNLIHTLLIAASIILFFASRDMRKRRGCAFLLSALIAGFLLSCLFITWDSWNGRYLLPLFALFCPFIAIVIGDRKNVLRRRKTLPVLAAILACLALAGSLFFSGFGQTLVRSAYNGGSIGMVNRMITGQNAYPVEYYHAVAHTIQVRYLLTATGALFIIALLYFVGSVRDMLSIVFVVASLPWIFFNDPKNLIGNNTIFTRPRTDQYFALKPYLKDPYTAVARLIRSRECGAVGIMMRGYAWEYPLWALLRENGEKKIRIEHINVRNISASGYGVHPFDRFDPDAIVSFKGDAADHMVYNGIRYTKELSMIAERRNPDKPPVHVDVFIR